MKILQIIPADGWWAMYAEDDDGALLAYAHPLVCWALVEKENGETEIKGMDVADTYFDFPDTSENFLGYTRIPADSKWQEEAKKR